MCGGHLNCSVLTLPVIASLHLNGSREFKYVAQIYMNPTIILLKQIRLWFSRIGVLSFQYRLQKQNSFAYRRPIIVMSIAE